MSCRNLGFNVKFLDCVIGRRRITIQPSPSGLAKKDKGQTLIIDLTYLPQFSLRTFERREKELLLVDGPAAPL
jgi:hypothetical protein